MTLNKPNTWPRTVTTGPLTRNGLQVFTFQTPQEATAAGYGWITRD